VPAARGMTECLFYRESLRLEQIKVLSNHWVVFQVGERQENLSRPHTQRMAPAEHPARLCAGCHGADCQPEGRSAEALEGEDSQELGVPVDQARS
jgi:hypothetical protein